MNVNDYLSGPEDLRRRELIWGMVREPPAPRYGHQSVVTRTTVILDQHVRFTKQGIVLVSPIDVVLDEAKCLVVQPDVIFIANDRAHIIREQVWGAPDLVVEVASRGTQRRDRTIKVGWYREYGVRECWLLDPSRHTVVVVNLAAAGGARSSRFEGSQTIQSSVLPGLAVEAQEFFN